MDDDLKTLQRLADCGGMEMEFLELKRDAERYRWLRGGKARTSGNPKRGRIEVFRWDDRSEGTQLKDASLDEAIDAAMATRG